MVAITAKVTGRDEAVRRISALVPRITNKVKDAVTGATINLVSHIKTDKLQGGHPLHRRSGNLTDNIIYEITQTQSLIQGRVYVGTGAPYGKIHEFGLTINRMVSMAWGRPMKDPHMVTFHYPKRSFMYSAFDEQREAIIERIERAATEGLRNGTV